MASSQQGLLMATAAAAGSAGILSATVKNPHCIISGAGLIVTSDGANIDTIGRGDTATTAIASGVKPYWEITINIDAVAHNAAAGIMNASMGTADNEWLGQSADGSGWYDDGGVYRANAQIATFATYTVGSVLCFAVDGANKWWGRVGSGNWNNDVIGNQNPATGTGGISITTLGTSYPAYLVRNGGKLTFNPGPTFANTPPSGFTGFP